MSIALTWLEYSVPSVSLGVKPVVLSVTCTDGW